MQQNAISVVHVAVGLLCVVIMVTIAVVVSETNARDRRRHPNSTQLRGIHQGMVTYANSNKDYFPGLGPDGLENNEVLDWRDPAVPLMQAGLAVGQRYAIMLEGDYFTPEYAISPSENDPSISAWPGRGMITTGHYSYAMLQIPEAGGRRDEWSQTLNTQAIVVSDRNTGTKERPSSIHLDSDWGWAGNVLWNDNHVEFGNATSEFETQYGGGELNEEDRLFESLGTDDALLIHAGN